MKLYPIKKLGEVVELHYGKGISKNDRKADGKYIIYGANGELGRTDKYLVEGEAIIVGRKGSAGEVRQVSGKFWPSDVAYYVLGNEKVGINYLFHLLKSLNLQRFAVGVKPGINRNRIYEIEIPLPPLEIQKKIVERIERLMGKIDEAKKLRKEAMADATALIPSALNKIFEEGEKNGWEEKSLEKVVEQKTSRNIKDNIPYIGMEDIESNSGHFLGSLKSKSVKSLTSYFDDSCVLYGKLRPYLNKVFIPNFEGHCSTEFIPLKPNTNYLTREWLAYWIMSSDIVKKIMFTTTGARMPRANMKRVMVFKIPLPSLPEQREIVKYLDSLSEKIRNIKTFQSATDKELKLLEKSVLNRAFVV